MDSRRCWRTICSGKRVTGMVLGKILRKVLRGERYYTVCVRKYGSGNGLFQFLPFSERYWYADPLGFEYNERLYLFMEIFDRKARKGFIGVSVVEESGVILPPEKVIQEEWHLSFPFVFVHQEKIYMLPESSGSGKLWLYRCRNFPYQWEAVSSVEGRPFQVDTVLFEYLGKLYALSSDMDSDSAYRTREKVELVSLEGEKLELSEADMEFDRKREYDYQSRAAGGFYHEDGRWKRAVQVSEEGIYGRRVEIREVQVREGKLEQNLCRLIDTEELRDALGNLAFAPEKNRIGIHTYNIVHGMEIVDLSFWHFSLWELWYRIRDKVDMLLKARRVRK